MLLSAGYIVNGWGSLKAFLCLLIYVEVPSVPLRRRASARAAVLSIFLDHYVRYARLVNPLTTPF